MKTRRFPLWIAVSLAIIFLISSVAFTGEPITKHPGVTVRTLAKGGPIHGANGLYFGPDGYLYVASVGGNEIVKMDPNSGRILDRIGPERGVFTPDDLTFGPDGSLYWTSIFTGNIGRLFPDGAYDDNIVDLGPCGNACPGVNPITFSPDNQWIYVARDFLGKGLFKIRPDGTDYTELLPDLVNLNGFDFGPDGCLYGPLYTDQPKVVKVDVNKTPPTVEEVITGIAPSAVKFDSQDRLITNDNFTGNVLRYNLGTGKMEVLATLPFSMDNLAVDSRNQVYVSSDADGYIAKILPKGNYILLNPGGMIFPSGVAVQQRPDGGESVYVGDMWSLREFDGRTGKSRGVASGGIISAGLTSFPLSVSPDGNNLIVAAPFNYKVQIYDPVNHQVLEDYSNPIYPSVPFLPVNAIRFQGDIWATDAATGLVVRRISGIWTPIFPATAPVGLATNGNNLWVADYALGMVFRIGSAAPVASGLNGPEGLAYYPPDGSLLVIESGAGRLSKINPTTGAKTILAEGLELGIHWLPPGLVAASDAMIDGVAVGPSGAIYVTGNKANVLYRIEIHP